MKNKRRFLIWIFVVLGVALLIAWFFSVVAYGFEVDAAGEAAKVRVSDILLVAGSAACLLIALLLALVPGWRGRSGGARLWP
ncbi:hypothetical protein [Microbacterium sp. GCS4]|uniref:hypothetical protein n=1 Tax=Microbacterium sp. GCS4 TaxID=1692239 RepID=UPI0009E2675E|nr:hypothetical protein [Microbacterium sp. GCS4]